MNKIYRIIWSKTKNCWIVVSEIAKRHGKTAARKGGTAVLGGLVAASLLAGMAVCRPVWAEDITHDFGFNSTITYIKFYNPNISGEDTPHNMMVWGANNHVNGTNVTAWGNNTTAYGVNNTAWGNTTKATGVGNSTAFGIWTVASGNEATAFGLSTYASGSQATAWGQNYYNRSVTDDKKIGARGIASTSFGLDTDASGSAATAFGNATKAGGDQATAFGKSSYAYGKQSTAFGLGSVAGVLKADATPDENYGVAATAFGNGSTAYANNSLAALGGLVDRDAANSAAIGSGAQASLEDTVALGSGSVANVAKMQGTQLAGYDPVKKANSTQTTGVWQSTHNAIAVGKSDGSVTRQIIGVAAGTEDTDAVNVAQLKAAVEASGGNATLATAGNSGSGSVDLGTQTLTVKGENDNITTTADGQQITVSLSKNLTGLESAKIADVTINSNGINAGGKKITNVAAGEISSTSTDAVNGSQLNDVITGGFGLTPDDTSKSVTQDLGKTIGVIGDTTYSIDGTKLEDGNITTSVSKDKDGNAAIKVALAKNLKIENITTENVTTNSITTEEIQMGDTHITQKDGDVFIDNSKIITGTDQLLHVQGDEGATKQINRKYDETLNVKGGAEGTLTDGNIGVTSDGTDTLTVKLAQNINLGAAGSVTMGDTKVDNDGLTITDGPSVTKTGGINAGGKKITNVAAGEISSTSTDAVNGSQLNNVITGGFGLTPDDTSKSVKQNLGSTISVIGDTEYGENGAETKAGNIKTSVSKDKDGNAAIKVELAKDLKIENITTNNITTNEIQMGDTHITQKDGDVFIDNSKIITGTDQLLHVQGDEGATKQINRKYDETLNVKGGAEGTLTDGNIGVTSDGKDTLTVKLAQNINLGTKGSVTFQKTKLDNTGLYIGDKGPKFTELGADMANHKITNLADGTVAEGSKDAINGGQLWKYIHEDDDAALTFAGNSGSVKKNLGETMTIKGTGEGNDSDYSADNIRTIVKDNELIVSLKKDLNVDSVTAGKDGKGGVTIKGEDGVGTIGLKGNDNIAVDITVQNGNAGLNGEKLPRIVYTDNNGSHQVATLDDGMKYGGDSGDVIAKKLNEQLDIKGGANKDALTNNNIGVISSGGVLNVKLAKDLQGLNSVNTANLTVPTDNGKNVVINNNGIDAGGNYITNVKAGVKDTDAVNYGQLKGALGDYTLKGDSGSATKKQTDNLTIRGEGINTDDQYSGVNVKTFVDNGELVVKLDKNMVTETVTTNEITTENVITNEITIKGEKGEDGKDANAVVYTKIGEPGLKGGDGITRIFYKDDDGNEHQVATFDDGMKYGGDFGDGASVKLNRTVNVVGEAKNKEDLTDGNIGVIAEQDGENGKLTVKLNKDIDLGANGSLTIGDTQLNNNGLTITNGPSVTNTGIDAGGNKITNVAAGVNDTDAVNYKQLKDFVNTDWKWELQANGSTVKEVKPNTAEKTGNNVVNFVAGDNVTIVDNTDANTNASSITISAKNDNVYTTGVKLSEANDLIFTRNDGKTYEVDLSSLVDGGGGGGETSTQDLRLVGAGDNLEGEYEVDKDHNLILNIADPTDKASLRTVKVKNLATMDEGLTFAGNTDKVTKKLGETITIKGEGKTTDDSTGEEIEYSGENVRTEVDKDGNLIVKLSKSLNASKIVVGPKGDQGEQGEKGEIGLIGPKGEDGKNAEAYISTDIGNPGLKGGDGITRLFYKDANGNEHQVATFDDGMKYGGDSGDVIAKYLNQQLDIKGGANKDALTDNNIGVISRDGMLNVKLAKDINLGTNGSVTMGDTKVDNSGLTITNGPSVTGNGVNAGGKKITNVADGVNDKDAVNYGQLKGAIDNIGGYTLKGNSGSATKKQTDILTIKGEGAEADDQYSGENVKTFVNNGELIVKLDKKLKANELIVGEKGDQGDPGTPGAIGLIGPKGEDGKNAEAYISTDIGNPGLKGGDGITRLFYKDADGNEHQVATFDDGMKYGGDSGDVIAKYLNQQLDIKGGADKDALTDNNIGVISSGGVLNVKLAKDINLGSDGSLKIGNALLNNAGLTITNGPSVTNTGIDAGGKKITNVAEGEISAGSKDAVNGGQLNTVKNDVTIINETVNAGWELQTNGVKLKDVTPENKVVNIKAGDNVTVSGSGNDVKISASDTKISKVYKTNYGQTVTIQQTNGKGDPEEFSFDLVDNPDPFVNEGDYRLISPENDHTKAYEVDENHTLSLEVSNGTHKNVVKIANLATWSDLEPLIDPTTGEAKGLTFEADKGITPQTPAEVEKKPGDRIAVKGDGNVNTAMDEEGNLQLSLSDKITTGTIVVGPAGADGKDGVTIKGEDGIGTIGLTGPKGADGKNATADISVQDGRPGLNGKDGITRIMYVDEDGQPHEVATFDDGLMFGGDTGTPVAKKLNEQLDIKGGVTDEDKLIDGNIGVVAKNGVLNVKLAKDLQGLNSVNTANLTVPSDNGKNVVINNNGIDAGSNKITNVAAGTNDSDAVNFSQIKGLVGEDGHTPLGMTFAGNTGSVTKKPGETVTIKGEGAEIDKDGKKIEYSAENVRTEVDEDGNVIVKLNKNMTTDTIITNEITINGANVTVKDGKDGLNGETVTRIIYKDPEGNEHQAATFDDGLKFKGDDGVEVAKNLNETLSIIGGADKDNLSDGNIGVVSDGEGGLNVKLAKDLKGLNSVEAGGTVLGNQGGLEDNKKNAVPEGSYLTGLGNRDWNTDDPTFVKGRAATEDQLAAVSKSLTDMTSAESGGGFGLTAEDGQSVKKDLGATVDVIGDGKNISTKVADGKVMVAMSDSIDLDQAVIGRDGKDGKDGVYIGDGAIQGKDGADGKDGISVRGADGKDGVTIYMDGSEGHIGLTGPKGADGKDATADISVKDGKPGLNGTDGITRIMYVDEDNQPHEVATFDDGLMFGGDTGTPVAKKLNEQLDIKGGITDTTKLSDNNIGVVSDGEGTLNVKLAKDLQGLDSIETKTLNVTEKITSNDIETNTLTVNERLSAKEIGADRMTVKDTLQIGEGANPVTINNDGMDMGGRSITNVAPGEVSATSTDAVNGSQLYQAQQAINQNATNIQNLGNQVNRLSDRVDKAGAGAAALAALHPLDFDPDAKWDVTAGYGHYRGENAAAVGAFYRPDENVMFSVASTVGNGDNMLSAGVTMKIDGKSRMNNSRTAMGKQIIEMRKEMEELRGLIADQAAGRQLDLSKLQLFPDTPENHWAYDYVTTLAGNGLLEGYPDGEFKGRRDLTRYEVAAILYRAMTNGAQLTERALREFAPELNRIRVDTISHHSDGTPSIQRVRVVKGRG